MNGVIFLVLWFVVGFASLGRYIVVGFSRDPAWDIMFNVLMWPFGLVLTIVTKVFAAHIWLFITLRLRFGRNITTRERDRYHYTLKRVWTDNLFDLFAGVF